LVDDQVPEAYSGIKAALNNIHQMVFPGEFNLDTGIEIEKVGQKPVDE
jgi:hypothetical protein